MELTFPIFPVLVTLLGLWVIVTFPVYISAKLLTHGRVSFGQAMGATLLGPIAYFIVFFITNIILELTIDKPSFIFIAFILAILAWLGTFKAIFKVGWLTTIGIVVLATIVFIISAIVLNIIMLTIIPDMPSNILPAPGISV